MHDESRMMNDACRAKKGARIFLRGRRGYTLIEMMVVMAISTLALAVVTTAVLLFYRTNSRVLAQGYALESARQGLQLAVGDIRGIQYGADGSYPLYSIAPLAFTFYTDTNKDGIAEKVRYFLSGTDFIRGVTFSQGNPPVYPSNGEVDTVLSQNVQNANQGVPIFRFYDAAGVQQNTLSIIDPVAYVTIALIVNATSGAVQSSNYTLRSTAALRNVSQF